VEKPTDNRPDSFRILHDFVRCEAHDTPSMPFHHSCSLHIGFNLICMMMTIDLNNELPRRACEISEVTIDRMLTAKFDAFQSMGADQLPANTLCPTGVSSKLSCSLRPSAQAPSPNLSADRGRGA
jgi:hypothetical protein